MLVVAGRAPVAHILAPGRTAPGQPDVSPQPAFEAITPTAQWRLPADLGRQYRRVSGDPNPIHTHRLAARAFGFDRPIIQGMWTHARLLAALARHPRWTAYPSVTNFILVRNLGWIDTFAGIIAPVFLMTPFAIFFLRQFFLGINREIEESASLDGAGPWRTFFKIILPMSTAPITTLGILTFITTWNDYFWPLIMLSGKEDLYTIPLGLAQLNNTFGTFPGLAMASGVIAISLPIIIFIIFQRYFMLGNVVTGVDK